MEKIKLQVKHLQDWEKEFDELFPALDLYECGDLERFEERDDTVKSFIAANFLPKSVVRDLQKELEAAQAYCRAQNGRPDCKNCGLEFSRLLVSLSQL